MKRTALYDEHLKLNGKIVEFAGWELPIQYSAIVEEHMAVRQNAGLFDVSHLGRIDISGIDALALIQKISTNDVSKLEDWHIQYGLICREDGGIVDDILVYKYPEKYLMVVNASNTDTVLDILQKNSSGLRVKFKYLNLTTSMIALQGPKAVSIIEKLELFPASFKEMSKYSFLLEGNLLLSRTGYTGDDGFEFIVQNEDAPDTWNYLLDKGKELDIKPCGLGARDTLRLEAGNCLYGHEMDLATNPYEAGLSFAVDLNKPDFIGRDSLVKIKQEGIKRKLVGLNMNDNSIPRNDYRIQKNGQDIGKVTSGTFCPSSKKGIAMGYVPMEYSKKGTEVDIVIREKPHKATVVQKRWR